MRAVLLLVACSIALGGVAAAQPEALPPQPPAELREDAAWQLYHEAFGALLEGKRKRAAELVVRLRREHRGHPAAALVDSSPLGAAGALDTIRRPRREEPTANATSELALFQTLHGLAVGIELCVVIDCDDGGPYVGLALLGATAGAVTSLKLVENVTSGQRALLNSGTAWGTFNAIMAIAASDPPDDRSVGLTLLAGQSVGIAAGALLWGYRPTAGQVALASSGGQWGAVLATLTLLAASPTVRDRELAMAALGGADAGIGMGAYLARLFPEVSRAQTLVIDAGGIVGGVGGAGIGVLLSGNTGDRATAALAALGAAGGLAATAYFTRGWYDSDEGSGPRAVLMPAEQGRGGLVGLAGSW